MAAAEDGASPPSATVYVKNLNERTKISELTETLRLIFEDYGTVLDVVARKNLKARGQAFIVFESVAEAQEAIDELQGFDVLGKEMKLDFARSRSDATVKQEDGDKGLEEHKRTRLAEKERKKALEAAKPAPKRPASDSITERPAKAPKAAPPGTALPDDMLPPNKVLLLKDIPAEATQEMLEEAFRAYPGLKEVRYISFRKVAFVEYENEEASAAAREGLNGMVIGDVPVAINFRRA